ncbi:MAG: DUF4340 domain-containing protein [Huintestinicola sp.]
MKSKIRLIIIIAVAALLLGGAVVALKLTAPESEPEEETTETEVTSSLLYDKNPDDILAITIKNETSDYSVERFGEELFHIWVVPEYIEAPIDGNVIAQLRQNAATLTAQKTVAENAEDLSIYGLAEPRAEYKVEFDDSAKTVKEICIGSSVPGSSSTVYACFKGENTVYTVKSSAISCFLEDKRSCIETTVYTAHTAVDENDTTDYTRINKMTVQRKDIDYDIVIEYDKRLEDEDAVIANSSSYRLTSPVTLDLNPDKCGDFTTAMFGLTASDFAVLNPTEEQKAEYGFDDPYADIYADIAGGEFHLIVGNPYNNEDGAQAGYYAMAEGIEVIYKFENGTLPWLDTMPLDLTISMITSNYIFTVNEIDITGSVEAHFTMTGSSNDDYAVKLNGNDVDTDSFKTLYQFILSAPAEQLYLEEPAGEADLTIEIKTADGGDVLEFYPAESRRTIIKLNGVPSFTCKTAYLERLKENIKLFENGEAIVENW